MNSKTYLPEVSVSSTMDFKSTMKIVSKEQSYSSLHSGQSLAWDHFRDDIDNPCDIKTNPCGGIADP